jgi:hypothetical protein
MRSTKEKKQLKKVDQSAVDAVFHPQVGREDNFSFGCTLSSPQYRAEPEYQRQKQPTTCLQRAFEKSQRRAASR